MNITRTWAMPNADTFSIGPIRQLVKHYLSLSEVSVDPFARNKRWATHTNDLNPDTAAEHHLEALEFLLMLKRQSIVADLVLFDPPYSSRQVAECYASVGREATQEDTQASSWTNWKAAIAAICSPDAIVLSFGWNSNGMGLKHNFSIEQILLVAHGGMHSDTICMVERRMADTQAMLGFT